MSQNGIRSSLLLVSLVVVSACRSTGGTQDSPKEAASTAKNSSAAAAAPLTGLPPAATPVTSQTAAATATISSPDQIQKLSCYRSIGASGDGYDNRFTISGSGTASNFTVDLVTSTGTTHYVLTAAGIKSGQVNFVSGSTKPTLNLNIATTTQNAHGLYSGSAVVTSSSAVTTPLTCDVNGQFRVVKSDRVKGKKAPH